MELALIITAFAATAYCAVLWWVRQVAWAMGFYFGEPQWAS